MDAVMNFKALTLDHITHSVREAESMKATLALLSRSFEPGRFHVVGGPSGSGKTTLLSVLSLTVRATQGMVMWGKQSLTMLGPAAQANWRRENLGLVFQTSRLVGVMNVGEHIRLAALIRKMPEAETMGIAILEALGMGEKLQRLPSQLSGGEKQRVAIAQALCCSPSILLADEPTAALDQANAELVAHTLKTYARQQNAVVICVSHDRAVIDAADELLTLTKP
jgi:putative ABC transport system ATP-binding protein